MEEGKKLMMPVVVVEVGLGWSTMLEAVASGSSATAARFFVKVVEVALFDASDDGRGR